MGGWITRGDKRGRAQPSRLHRSPQGFGLSDLAGPKDHAAVAAECLKLAEIMQRQKWRPRLEQ